MQNLPSLGESRLGNTVVWHYKMLDETLAPAVGAATFTAATATELDVVSPQVVALTPTLLTGTTNVYRVAFDPPNGGRWKIDVSTSLPLKTRDIGVLLVRP